MTPEELKTIEQLAAALAHKRMTLTCYSQLNMSYDPIITIQRAKNYAVIQAEIIEAENALADAMPERSVK